MIYSTPNDKRVYEVSPGDLPVYCPGAGMSLWDSHPRVYIPLADAPQGRAICPYCGAEYILKEQTAAA
jgi:uncharacterized Zn-finger protein